MNLRTRFGLLFVLILMFNMSGGAQSISLLLEKGIYTEETLGNLPEAIKIYQQIIANPNTARPWAAQAMFRLGMCYQKSGRKELAKTAFGKLATSYPEQHDLIARIPASPHALQLKPAPWVDGEILKTVTGDSKGMVLMRNEYRVASVRESGQSAWQIKKYSIGMAGTFQSAHVQVDARTITPIRSRIINRAPRANYAYQAEYAPDHIDYFTVVNGTPGKSRRLAVDSIVYDYEALLQLIRCLPLALDFDFTVPTLITAIGSVFDERIKVVGREAVTVPAGIFDCYKILISDHNIERDRECWISADGHSYPVKSSFANTVEELESVAVAADNQSAHLDDPLTGISLSAPPGWLIGSFDLKVANRILIMDPELTWEGELWVEDRPQSKTVELSPSWRANAFKYDQSKVEGFMLRPGSQDATPVAGLSALRWIVEYLDPLDGHRIVAHRAVFLGDTKIYSLEFRSDESSFDRLRAILDSILASIKLR